ncbi:MAG: hypothetical protein QM758_13165 [Armatimonas sp.]
MRAILPIKTEVPLLSPEEAASYKKKDYSGKVHRREFLEALMKKATSWLVEDALEAESILDEVMSQVSEDDYERVSGQYVLSLKIPDSSVVGLLGVKDTHTIEIRLKSNSTSELKQYSASCVQRLLATDKIKNGSNGLHFYFGFSFPEDVQIYSKSSREQIWKGEVHPEDAKQRAFVEMSSQVRAFNYARGIAVLTIVLTLPFVRHCFHALFSGLIRAGGPFLTEMVRWGMDFAGKLPPAALLTAVFTRLAIQSHIDELKREGFISWTPV